MERLLAHEPDTQVVLLTGSYARETADATSDLDLTALTPHPRVQYRMWFDGDLHVSADARTLESFRERASRPASWSLAFPARVEARYLRGPELLGRDPSPEHPAGPPALEDFVEFVSKTIRADEDGARWFAREAASRAPSLLIPLNDRRVVTDRRDALTAALGLTIAPDGYAADMRVALGLDEGDARAAVSRLAAALIAFLRDRAPDVDPTPDLERYLRDGTLARHLGLDAA
ncbi:MAG TPA: nucleotidyltransferase domain-containing protein [Gaiellaceae bacterium]